MGEAYNDILYATPLAVNAKKRRWLENILGFHTEGGH